MSIKQDTADGRGTPGGKRNIAFGEVKVCCHRVEFYYELDGETLGEDALARLEEEAEDRAKTIIADENCGGGELCCVVDEKEFYGWWNIDRA